MAFVEDQLNFRSKSATAANFHVMESLLLYNWLKNSNVNIDVIYSITFAVSKGLSVFCYEF